MFAITGYSYLNNRRRKSAESTNAKSDQPPTQVKSDAAGEAVTSIHAQTPKTTLPVALQKPAPRRAIPSGHHKARLASGRNRALWHDRRRERAQQPQPPIYRRGKGQLVRAEFQLRQDAGGRTP